MLGALINTVFASQIGRWVTLGVVTLLLGGAVYKWVDFKSDLRDEGQQECIQKITQATVDSLEIALAEEKIAREKLIKRLLESERLNADALARTREAEQRLKVFERERENQAAVDPPYREWRDIPLPDGVTDRLRSLAGSNQDTSR